MDITSINTDYTSSINTQEPAKSNPSDFMDSTDFMLLMLTQLRNQNPLEPVSNNEMMSQFTQINSFNELQKISGTLELLLNGNQLTDAANLIGKTAEVVGEDGNVYEGVVSGVSLLDGEVMLTIDDQQFPLSSITSVKSSEPSGGE